MAKAKSDSDNQLIFTSEKIEEIRLKNDDGYKISRFEKYWFSNLPMVRRSNLVFDFSDDEVLEYAKCKLGIDINGDPYQDNSQIFKMSGIDYFAETYCKVKNELGAIRNIKLRDYQKSILNMYMENRFSVLTASRQCGKCLIFNELCFLEDDTSLKLYELWFKNLHNKNVYIYLKYTIYKFLDFLSTK